MACDDNNEAWCHLVCKRYVCGIVNQCVERVREEGRRFCCCPQAFHLQGDRLLGLRKLWAPKIIINYSTSNLSQKEMRSKSEENPAGTLLSLLFIHLSESLGEVLRCREILWNVPKGNQFLSTQALNFWENNEKLQTAIHFQAEITRILILFRIYCKSIFILTKIRMPLDLKFKLLNNPNFWCHTSPLFAVWETGSVFAERWKLKKKKTSEKYYIWLKKRVWKYSLVSIQVKVPKLSFVHSSKT